MSDLFDKLKDFIHGGGEPPELPEATDNPGLTATEARIIDLLGTHEMAGWDLVRASDGKLKRGTVFVLLARMEDKGFIESKPEPDDQRRGALPRQLYRVTGTGHRVHRAWQLARAAHQLAWEGA